MIQTLSTTNRYSFLDLYRGLFVLLMLEGHVVRQLLQPASTASDGFQLHELIHGITGPGFFFGAGFTFAISSLRRWESVTRFSPGFFRRIGRSALLLVVGYALHIPFFSLRKVVEESTPAQWNALLVFGVLQSVGVTLFALYILLVILRNERLFLGTLMVVLPAIVYLTGPITAWAESPEIPLWIRSAFSIRTGSPYPITPFAGFIVAGVLAAWGFLRAGQKGLEHRFMVMLFRGGGVLLLYGICAERFLFPSRDEWTFWTTGPNFFWIRLGVLLLFLALLWFGEEHLRHAILPKWLTLLGVESFFVYIVHLPILYGWVTNPTANLTGFLGPTLQPVAAIAVVALLLGVMTALAQGWRSLRKGYPTLSRVLMGVIVLVFSVAFVTNPH